MKLVGRIPVEPLDDARMTNIERRVVIGAADDAARPVPAPRRGFGLALATAAIAATCAGVIGYRFGAAPSSPIVAEAPPLRVDTTVEPTTLDLGDATIASDPATRFVVTRPAGGVLVDLARGKVELQVGKRGERPPLIVRAGDTDVVVIGTRFSVDYGDGTGGVEVRVTEGVVEVVHRQQTLRVAAGQAWQRARGVIAIAEAGRPAVGRRASGADGVGGEGGRGVDVGATEDGRDEVASAGGARTGSGAYEIDMGAAPEVLRDRTGQVPDTRPSTEARPATGATGATGATTTRPPSTTTRPVRDDPKDPGRNLKKMIRAQRVEPAMDVGETVAATAVSKYYTIIREQRGEQEARAFYSIAVTQDQQLGRSEDALKTLDGFFRRFSRGKVYPQHASALWLRLRIVCLRAIDASCRQAAAAYLRASTGTPAAAVAELITLSD